LVNLRRPVSNSNNSWNFLSLCNRVSRSFRKDVHCDSLDGISIDAYYQAIFSAVFAHCKLAGLVLFLQVCHHSTTCGLSVTWDGEWLNFAPRKKTIQNHRTHMISRFRFFSLRFIPAEMRPHIWVRVLPALENIIYGANLSNIISAHKHPILDVLAWLPYGIIHFGAPFVCAGVIFLFAAPGTLRVYSRSFGYMNLIGVLIQLCFPCAPPCKTLSIYRLCVFLIVELGYESMYGSAPANYSMAGSPAGLARIDKLFGLNMYTSTFTASPLVFGAMPSLHAGCATIEALFMAHVFPRARWLFYAYVMWIWWATLYLQHHYAVDLIAGSLSMFYLYERPVKANDPQCLGLYFTLRRLSSLQGCSLEKNSDGTTIILRSALAHLPNGSIMG
jgi:hypothetical protein